MDAPQYDRLPPHDPDAEIAAIGSLMAAVNGEERSRIRAAVRKDDFFQADHQVIYECITALDDAGKPIDAILVRERLDRAGLLAEVGGTAYLAKCLTSMPTAAHGEHYARIVRQKATLRNAIAAANDVLRAAYGPAADGADLARAGAEKLWQIANHGSADAFVHIGDAAHGTFEAKQADDVPRLATGMLGLDNLFGGIPLRKFTLIGGRPGMGKSLLAKQIALNVARMGTPVGIVTIEEERTKIADNAIANFSGVENNKLTYRVKDLDATDWQHMANAVGAISKLPIWINDEASRLSEVEEAVTCAAVKHKCKLVVVDYLQLIDPDKPSDNENREITQISKALKRLAKRLDIAMLAACQLNRGNENGPIREPRLRDLRGSGSIEQDGDLILLLHRPDYYLDDEQIHLANGQLKAIVAKNKDGPQATVPLKFLSKTQRIEDWNEYPDVSDKF